MKIRVNIVTLLGDNYVSAGSHFDAIGTQTQQVSEGCHCDGSYRLVDKLHYQIVINDQVYLINEDFVTVIPTSDSNMLEPGSPQDRLNDRLLNHSVEKNFDPIGQWDRMKKMSVIDLRGSR